MQFDDIDLTDLDRFTSGFPHAVFSFLRVRTWMRGSATAADPELVDDTVWLARQERLEAHARAAERRSRDPEGVRA